MNRGLKVALVCGLALTAAACGTVRRAIPFGLGGGDEPQATASAGERISVLQFEQQLSPSAALSGRDFFLPGPTPVTSWAQPGGNAENSVEHAAAAANFEIAWRRNIGSGAAARSQIMAPPVIADNRVFVLDGEATVVAVDAGTGEVAWRADLKPDETERGSRFMGLSVPFTGDGGGAGGFGGGVAVSGGRVYVSSGYRTMTALDAATGAVVWTSNVDVPLHGAPTVAGGRVFVIDVENQIYAFDAASGRQEWSYRGISEPARVMRASSPAVTGDTVLAPFSSGEVVALRASTGQSVWQQTLSRTSRTSALSEIRDIAGRPVVSRGVVYAVSYSGVLAAMDLRSGQPKWQVPVSGVNAPLPAGDVVYVVSKTGELAVINRDNGQVYWTRNLNEGRVRQEGGVFGLWDRTVRPTWAGPILASNQLVLVNSDGEAIAFDPKTGETKKTLRLGSPAFLAPAAYNGALYVVTNDGTLICIR